MPALVRVEARQAAATCAYCHDPLTPARSDCVCGAAYHVDCFVELGRCATLGCYRKPAREDRAAGGRCPWCDGDVRRAFAWELRPCDGCGTRYHLGCRAARVRCCTQGCESGVHDDWGAPRRPTLTARGRALLVAGAAAVASARGAVRRSGAAALRRAVALVAALVAALVRAFAQRDGIWYKRPDWLRTWRRGRDVVRPGPPHAPHVGSAGAYHPDPGRVRPLQRGRGRRGR